MDVSGWDISSSLPGAESGYTSTPGQVARRYLDPSKFPQFEVDTLWDDVVQAAGSDWKVNELPAGPSEREAENLVDRAWVTAL